jgi:hypothetical protein
LVGRGTIHEVHNKGNIKIHTSTYDTSTFGVLVKVEVTEVVKPCKVLFPSAFESMLKTKGEFWLWPLQFQDYYFVPSQNTPTKEAQNTSNEQNETPLRKRAERKKQHKLLKKNMESLNHLQICSQDQNEKESRNKL